MGIKEFCESARRRALDYLPRRKSDIELIRAALSELEYGTKAYKYLDRLKWKLETDFRMDCVPNNDREVEVTVLNGNVPHRMSARFVEGLWVSAYDKHLSSLEYKGVTVNAWREKPEPPQ